MQISRLSYDQDTGVLDLQLATGEEYRITHAGHAKTVKDRISVGGQLSMTQRAWLEKYRVQIRNENRERLRERLRELRRQIREL